jgi:DNA (cytosine-5)-methyltransferase 1
MLDHFSLFSGIGSNDLAAEWAGFRTVGQCEWADFPTKVLEKHWPDVPRWRDIHDLTGESIRSRGIENITVLSGGFPCQPHSTNGLRKASTDERDLWPEYKRIIRETQPRWVVGENVAGLLTSESGRFFGGILRDLADLGFDVGWSSVRASWVGAIHQRERIFIVAHSSNYRSKHTEYAKGERLSERGQEEGCAASRGLACDEREFHEQVRASVFVRNSNGIPNRMDRIKSLGNSIVPHQVYPIYQAIADIEAQSAGE